MAAGTSKAAAAPKMTVAVMGEVAFIIWLLKIPGSLKKEKGKPGGVYCGSGFQPR
jgi:hypothetical protein